MQKCNLCYDRTSQGKGPMCATVCPTQAIFYGTYEEWVAAGRAKQGAKPVNTFFFGKQRVRTRNYAIMREQDEELDVMALVAEADLGWRANLPDATTNENVDSWVDAESAGIPQRKVPPQPWMPRVAPRPVPTMMAVGVARPKAQGQAMISTATAFTMAVAKVAAYSQAAMARPLASCCRIRRCRVFVPRSASQLSNGPGTAPAAF